ncbi:MAG: SHOCT domain-containing protein [Deltaproteobacteria bacterium]|nr:SHOCT domain-containing protein [Deltaproteobacteria bacterium]
MKTFHVRDAGRLSSVFVVLVVLLVFSSISAAADVRMLWQSRDQFVALERQDSPAGVAAILNDHPVEIPPDRLTAMLASITLQLPDNKTPEQLITTQSLEVLVPELLAGFKKASPGEDVTFAVIGLHRSLYGFAKSPKVTTGRAFYKGGSLNLIIGFAQKDFNEREDRRLSPFIPGSRQKPLEGEWQLLPQPGQNDFRLTRKDWVSFGDKWQPAVAKTPTVEKISPAVQNGPAQPQPVKPGKDLRKPAERLTTLNELKEKGLISEEEFRSKRSEILNGI